MLEVVLAFGFRELVEDSTAEFPELVVRSFGSVTEEFLQFREGPFDRVQIGRAGGRPRNSAPASSIAARIPVTSWLERLSITTLLLQFGWQLPFLRSGRALIFATNQSA